MHWLHGESYRVGFLPEEMYFFQDAWKKLENSCFFRKKMEEMEEIVRNYSETCL